MRRSPPASARATPAVALTRRTPRAAATRSMAWKVGIGGAVTTVEERVDGEPVEHGGEPAVVVTRGVGGDHEGEPLDARLAQEASHPCLGRTTVEQDRRAVGVLDQRGVALPDVEEADRQAVRR